MLDVSLGEVVGTDIALESGSHIRENLIGFTPSPENILFKTPNGSHCGIIRVARKKSHFLRESADYRENRVETSFRTTSYLNPINGDKLPGKSRNR